MLDYDAGRWLSLLTDAAVKSAAVLTVTLAVFLGLRREAAATRHLTLLAGITVLLGLPLLMPFVPRQILLKAPAPPVWKAAAPVPVTPIVTPAPSDTAVETPTLSPAPSLPSPAVVSKPPRLSPLPRALPAWIVLGWLAGVLLCAVRVLVAQSRVWRLIRRCSPLTGDWLRASDAETEPFAHLQTSSAGTPPMVWGWPRPTLLLPSDAAQWPEARLRAVLLHEAAHVRRQDWLTQTLTQTACALYWFNPLVWLTASRMQAEAERACDDAVLLAGVPPADYAQDLLAVARALTSAQRASFGAVTMARHSPVRTRLEAILDPARPRRRTTPRAAALALTLAFAVAVPLAALRPAARAAAPSPGQPAPAAGVPTEADIANVQQHLQSLEQAQAAYAAAHPNTLTAAQIADVDRLIQQMEYKRDDEQFAAQEATDNKRLRAEAKKPHTKKERQQIWEQVFAFEHTSPIVLKRQHDKTRWFTQQQKKVNALPAEQRIREQKMYAFDLAVAVDKTQIEAMQMERAEGYSLHLSQDEIAMNARMGLQWEKQGGMSRADWVHTEFLNSKLNQEKHLDDADVDSLIAILRVPSQTLGISHATVMVIFQKMRDKGMRDVPLSQQQKIREAVTPLLTSHSQSPLQDKWDPIFAKQVLKKFGGRMPTPLPPQKAQAAPAPAVLPALPQPNPTGVSPMTSLKSLKAALLKTAVFATLAAGLTPKAVSAPPVIPAKPAFPAPVIATATDALHWHQIVLKHSTVGTNPALTHWQNGGDLPDGVKRLFFLTKNNSLLVQATADGFAKMQEIIKRVDVAPRQVPTDLTAANTFGTKKLILQNMASDTVLSLLHWNQGGVLPEGVKQITSLPKENALLVVANPAGFAKVQEIIKSVDVAPRQVQIKVALANVPQTAINALGVNFVLVPQDEMKENSPSVPLQYLDGNIAAELFKAFTKQGRVVEAPVITTTSNVAAGINISSVQPNSTLLNLNALRVTPRVNADDSITLLLHWTISLTTRQGTAVKTIQEINVLRTIRSGDTLALSVAAPKSAGESGQSLLLFISPIIIGESNNDVTVKDSAGQSITVSL